MTDRHTTPGLGQRAIVAGAGLAGLLTARVLADHFEHVVLLDPDRPRGTSERRGVPQGRHLHVLLPGGLDATNDLLPGFAADLDAAGAIEATAGVDFVFYRPEGRSHSMVSYRPEPRARAKVYLQSRGLLEHAVRVRVEAMANIEPRYGERVAAPWMRAGSVAGAVIGDEQVPAELVVDATGRSSSMTRWLGQLGVAMPAESVVNCDISYSSARFRLHPDREPAERGRFVPPRFKGPYGKRGGVATAIEHGEWIVTLSGTNGDFPPSDPSGFSDFAATLAAEGISDLLVGATAVSAPARYRTPRSVRRHFERLDHAPDGILAVGDAVCHFNPVYGQGMSVAAMQARTLGSLLDDRARRGGGLERLPFEFYALAAEVIRSPWALSAAADFANPLCTGDFPTEELPALAAFQRLLAESETDDAADGIIAEIMALRTPLTSLVDAEGSLAAPV
jgi:2-polyprenyl-6-methoxyphenol hydroxylase-like FAD-dependent oxidoreductase